MNTRAKVTVVALFSVFAFASNPARADGLGFSGTLPSIGAVTAEVAKVVAADVTSYLRKRSGTPRGTDTPFAAGPATVVETAAIER